MTNRESTRRRDVLRAGTAAGLAALGWSATAASAQETTTGGEGGQQNRYAFSYSLQQGDRFRVLSRLRTPEGDPATETVPASCDPNGGQQYPVFVVRAYRQNIRLGYEGVLVPEGAVETAGETTGTTETEEETTPPAEETTVTDGETTTTAEETTTTAETETETQAEAALQDETTTEAENGTDAAAETETTVGTEATTDETEAEATTTEGEADATTATETTTTATTETTTQQAAGLPPIRVGDWYRVAAMSKCDSVSRLSLEPAEPPETTASNS